MRALAHPELRADLVSSRRQHSRSSRRHHGTRSSAPRAATATGEGIARTHCSNPSIAARQLVQAGLFDRRALRAAALDATSAASRQREMHERAAATSPVARPHRAHRRTPRSSPAMIPGLSGSLLSHEVLAQIVPIALHGLLDEAGREPARRRLRAWHVPLRGAAGPGAGAARHLRPAGEPLLSALGYHVVPADATTERFRAVLERCRSTHGRRCSSRSGDIIRRRRGATPSASASVRASAGASASPGPASASSTARGRTRGSSSSSTSRSRSRTKQTFAVLWGLLRGAAMAGASRDSRPLLDRAIELSEQHRASVRSSLQHGVHDALGHLTRAFSAAGRRRRATARAQPDAPRPQARPGSPRSTKRWSSSIGSCFCSLPRRAAWCRAGIRSTATATPSSRSADRSRCCRGRSGSGKRCRPSRASRIAAAASARCACRRSTAGCSRPRTRRSPTRVPLDDGVVRQALLALTTRPRTRRIRAHRVRRPRRRAARRRVRTPARLRSNAAPRDRGRCSLVRSERRKSTGAFYTPRPLTEYLVRRALAPLVHEASSEAILALRILDPAMGSGAFLVAACRYLASAYEAALVREGGFSADDITERERAEFRRTVAQRCLYGVDINPMAVQLGRLSLWLATLAADRPLTFLDHRLRTGNSLVGASPADIARQAPGGDRARTTERAAALWRRLLRCGCFATSIAVRSRIATEPGDTLEQVRAKEHALDRAAPRRRAGRALEGSVRLSGAGRGSGESRRQRAPYRSARSPTRSLAAAACPDMWRRRSSPRPGRIAARERFFHWTLEFPEIFRDAPASRCRRPGSTRSSAIRPGRCCAAIAATSARGRRRGRRPRG